MSFRTHVTLVVQQQTNGPAFRLAVPPQKQASVVLTGRLRVFLALLYLICLIFLSTLLVRSCLLLVAFSFTTYWVFPQSSPFNWKKEKIWLVQLVTFQSKEFGCRSSCPVTIVIDGWTRCSCFFNHQVSSHLSRNMGTWGNNYSNLEYGPI